MRLIVIGGVAGGATAAARARRLSEGAEILIIERGPAVSFANCGLPYAIGGEIERREALLLQTPEGFLRRYRIEARVRTEALRIDRGAGAVHVRDLPSGRVSVEPFDRLILAPGAAPVRPPLPGFDDPRVFALRGMDDLDAIRAAVDGGARRALVVGGGFIGLEVAENLRRRGLEVEVIELGDQVMPPLDREMVTPIHEELARNGVCLRLGDAVARFEAAGERLGAVLSSGARIEGDFAVVGIGVRPEVRLAAEAGLEIGATGGIRVDKYLRTSDPRIFAVGDAIEVRDAVLDGPALVPLAGPANRQGRIAANNIFGKPTAYRGTGGTSIVRVFGLEVGTTGASEKTLRRAGLAYQKAYIHPFHHAAYFPGARQMTLKLLYGADGRVLGAQAVGGAGVDKRIDVLSVAVAMRMSVFDLEEMELAYAPQFGSAKDPVNMIGFVAGNALRGDVKVIHADAIPALPPAEWTLLDVRTSAEHAGGNIPGSTLIPVDELRARIGELPRDRKIAVYCQVGLRGYVAARILKANGFAAWNLSGGYRTWRMFHPAAPRA